MNWLIITHIITLALLWYHPRYWVAKDTAAITADGSAQSLTHAFHQGRLLLRLGFVVAVALAASLPLLTVSYKLLAISAAGLAAIGGTYFFFDFTPRLNVARAQPYIGKYHVSWAVGASWLDRTIWRRAWQRVKLPAETAPPAFPRPEVVAEAALLLRRVLWVVLAAGAAAYLASLFLLTR